MILAMARFPLVDPAIATDPVARRAFGEIERELGFGMVPNIFRSMGTNPALLAANWQKFKATILQGVLPRSVKEMLGVVVSHINRSDYAKQVHLHSLSVQGVQELWLRQVIDAGHDDSVLPDAIRAMVNFTWQAARDPHTVGDEAYQTLYDAGLTAAEVFEVIATIDLFQSVNAYTDLVAVEVDQI